MEELMGWFFLFIAVLVVVGLAIDGVVLLFIHFWWVIVPALLLAAWAWYRHHPGVRAKRELRTAAKRAGQMRQDIRVATEQAKADMYRIARDWKRP
jgi:membrane protein implicated in regulation of membrane protease activity